MKFLQGECETLIGPAAVGVVLGIVFTACTVAFNSEYNAPLSFNLATIGDTMLSFFGGFFLAFVPFGLAPVLIGRFRFGAGTKNK